METPRLLFSAFKMQTVFTSENKGFLAFMTENSRKVTPRRKKFNNHSA